MEKDKIKNQLDVVRVQLSHLLFLLESCENDINVHGGGRSQNFHMSFTSKINSILEENFNEDSLLYVFSKTIDEVLNELKY